MSKNCPKCGLDQDPTNFHSNRAQKDGLSVWCKACNNEWAATKHLRKHYSNQNTVYVLTCIPTGEQYVGSTTVSLEKRLWLHRSDARRNKTSKVYSAMRTWSDPDMWSIDALEEHEFGAMSKRELREKEQAWINKLGASLNTVRALREVA